ncbi:DNA polymerase III subunit beta [Fusobacterium massiliense]|uniref:DNA polymerase III subunit beta n=1 Tax=Fusobacterium massiliense TaxID=1852365 RepID=UPI0028D57309|nr:DNA polymerase III subunit beta [Fusobacterium massiliense]
MHIKVNRQDFLSSIRIVEKAIKESKIKPIISCVYVKVKDNRLYFTGTNLETTIKTSIFIEEVYTPGEIVFYPSIIDEYIKEIKDEFITLKLSNNNVLSIETQDSVTEYDVFKSDDYPNTFENIVLDSKNFVFQFKSEELVSIFEKVLFSADTPDNIGLNCIRIESVDNNLHFVSTNTYRLTFLRKTIDKSIDNFQVSVLAETVSSLIKIIKGLPNDDISIYNEGGHLYFQYRDTTIISKLLELKFPDYAGIFENIVYDKKLTIKNEILLNLLKRVLIFSRTNMESKYSSTYDFKIRANGEKKLTLSALNEVARINEVIDVEYEGEDLKISLNSKYLLEFIQNIPRDKEIELELRYPNSAVKVTEKGNNDYVYIIMPLALRD